MNRTEVNPKVAAWMARVIEAIGNEGAFNAGYGEYHLGPIPIMFDGDPLDLAIDWDENGEMTIVVNPTPNAAEVKPVRDMGAATGHETEIVTKGGMA